MSAGSLCLEAEPQVGLSALAGLPCWVFTLGRAAGGVQGLPPLAVCAHVREPHRCVSIQEMCAFEFVL